MTLNDNNTLPFSQLCPSSPAVEQARCPGPQGGGAQGEREQPQGRHPRGHRGALRQHRPHQLLHHATARHRQCHLPQPLRCQEVRNFETLQVLKFLNLFIYFFFIFFLLLFFFFNFCVK